MTGSSQTSAVPVHRANFADTKWFNDVSLSIAELLQCVPVHVFQSGTTKGNYGRSCSDVLFGTGVKINLSLLSLFVFYLKHVTLHSKSVIQKSVRNISVPSGLEVCRGRIKNII